MSSAGSVDVAVKQLKDNVTEKDRVKFLQEAAIMGQFTHPGIVMMFGVVKEVKPVRFVDVYACIVCVCVCVCVRVCVRVCVCFIYFMCVLGYWGA